MDQATHNKIVSFIWGIADDVLRDLFRRGKYPDVILPMCVLRRMDAVLEPTKQSVLDTKKMLDDARITEQRAALAAAAGQAFYNTSRFTLRDLRFTLGAATKGAGFDVLKITSHRAAGRRYTRSARSGGRVAAVRVGEDPTILKAIRASPFVDDSKHHFRRVARRRSVAKDPTAVVAVTEHTHVAVRQPRFARVVRILKQPRHSTGVRAVGLDSIPPAAEIRVAGAQPREVAAELRTVAFDASILIRGATQS